MTPDDYRQRLIVRQSSLKAAIDLCGQFKEELQNDTLVLEIAERFETWVFRDMPKEPTTTITLRKV